MNQPDVLSARQRFLKHLANKHLRLTCQRQAILDAIFNTDRHFTAEQLWEWSRQRDKSVSRATVYRTLPLLVESGMVRELDFGGDYKLYDPNYVAHPNHNHIICEDCGRIFEFENTAIEQLESQIARDMGFGIRACQLRITARCEELHRTGFCINMPAKS